MKVIFSNHASLKIAERRLSREKILKTVTQSDVRSSGRSGREELFRKFGRKYLKVVIVWEIDVIVVVTAHWVARMPQA